LFKKKKIPRFFVTGHSLGGAIAQLCGLYLHVLFGHRSSVYIYVYGVPRVGDTQFAEFLNKRVPHTYRLVYRGDVMTTLPRGLGYYKHSGWEVIVDKHGNMIVDPSSTEKSLLPARRSIADHLLIKYVDSLNAICRKHQLLHMVLEVPPLLRTAQTKIEKTIAADIPVENEEKEQ